MKSFYNTRRAVDRPAPSPNLTSLLAAGAATERGERPSPPEGQWLAEARNASKGYTYEFTKPSATVDGKKCLEVDKLLIPHLIPGRLRFAHVEDGGHGWLQIGRELVEALGVLDEISAYSYQRGAFLYLEEDCDMAKPLAALQALGYENVEWVTIYDARGLVRTFGQIHRRARPAVNQGTFSFADSLG